MDTTYRKIEELKFLYRKDHFYPKLFWLLFKSKILTVILHFFKYYAVMWNGRIMNKKP